MNKLNGHPIQADIPSKPVRPRNSSKLITKGTSSPPDIIESNVLPADEPGEINSLASLTAIEYDRVRKSEAARLGVRVDTLDAEVARLRAEIEDQSSVQSVLASIPACEPWPEPVTDSATLFHEIASRFSRCLVLPPGAADALALWTGGTHAYDAFPQFPRLNLTSSQGGCGKSTAIDILSTMVRRPLQSENIRAAVLFRIVELLQPTLLLDEVDTYLRFDEELRGLLNSGHRNGVRVYRCEGEGRLRAFKAYAPAALAGIGELPATLHDRSIHILLAKAKFGELLSHFDRTQIEPEKILSRKLARWAVDTFASLKTIRPTLPPNAYNRLGDNWRPLFAIAQAIGGDWPERTLSAFNLLGKLPEVEAQQGEDPSELLAEICEIFTESGCTKIRSKDLVAALLARKDRTWLKTLTGASRPPETLLARQLSKLGIKPRTLRFNGAAAKGYLLEDFLDRSPEV